MEILLKSGPLTAKEIIELTQIPKTTVYRILNKLLDEKLIQKEEGTYFKEPAARYRITLLGKRILNNFEGKLRIHDIKVILRRAPVNLFIAAEEGKQVKLKNWEAYYITLSEGATAQINDANETTVVLHLPEFYASNRDEAYLILQNIVSKYRRELKVKGIITEDDWIDYSWRIAYMEFAEKLPENDPSAPGTELYLNRPAIDLKGESKEYEARVWIDKSLGTKEIETNDAEYAYKRIMEPLWIEELYYKLNGYDNFFEKAISFLNDLIQVENKLAVNIQKHIELTSNVSNAARETTEGIREIKESTKQITQAVMHLLQANQHRNKPKKDDYGNRRRLWFRIPKSDFGGD